MERDGRYDLSFVYDTEKHSRNTDMSTAVREKLVVSVDDFGIRNTVSVILPLAQAGKVDRVAVLINYLRSREDAEALKATGVKIDLHLEAIRLIRSGDKVKESALIRAINFGVRYCLGLVTKKRIEREWTAQIERFKEMFGRYPDGLNSHEHIHFFPRFFHVFTLLGERYQIPFLRFSHQGILRQPHSLVSSILSSLWQRDRQKVAVQNMPTSDFLVSFDWLKNPTAFFAALPEGKTEIVFHPERPEEYDVVMGLE